MAHRQPHLTHNRSTSPADLKHVSQLTFPPTVWVKRGICSADSLINIALCCLGVLPGLLHAWYIIWTYPDPGDEYERIANGDAENARDGHVTYYYVAHAGGPNNQQYRSYGGAAPARPVPKSTSSQQFPGQQRGAVNNFAGAKPPPPPKKQGGGAAAPSGGDADGGEGSTTQPPPTYAEAVRGDHKVQTHD